MPFPMRRGLLPAGLCAAALLAGCGEDRLSKAEYAERGNAACTEFARAQERLPEAQGIDDLPRLVDDTSRAFDTLIGKLEDLSPPEELQDKHDALLDTADYAKGKLGELKTAAKAGDEAKITKIARDAQQKDRESDRLARQLGLAACADT